MNRDETHPRLMLVRGGRYADEVTEGPITRLGQWERFKPFGPRHLALLLIPKLILLGVVLYFLYR